MSTQPEAARETVLMAPAAARDASLPAPRDASEQLARVRFGPGVPVLGAPLPAAAKHAEDRSERSYRRRVIGVLSTGLTVGIIAFVVWFLWPAGALHTRSVSVRANPSVVTCNSSGGGASDVVATVATNGNPGTLRYQWLRGDGTRTGVLRQSLTAGQRTAFLHLRWTFTGRGTYAASATLRLLSPDPRTAATHFTYRCGA